MIHYSMIPDKQYQFKDLVSKPECVLYNKMNIYGHFSI